MCRRNGLRRKVTVLVNPGNIAQTEATLLEVRGADGLVVDPNYKGKGLQLQFTVEDDGVFTTPWSATVTYRRGFPVMSENICAEDPNVSHHIKE